MKKLMTVVGVGAWVAMVLLTYPCLAADKVFSETPTNPAKAYPKFHIGVSGIYATIEKGLLVTVDSTETNTPAAGKFQKGDIIIKVDGKPVSGADSYIALGNALTAAEAGDGKMVFVIKRADKEETVTIAIPVLGAYSKTWPLNCKKSDTIVRQTAAFLSRPDRLKERFNWFGGLGLLSTGDDRDLPAVKTLLDCISSNKWDKGDWSGGYAGVLMGEYYLRTGDKAILPRLKAICDYTKERHFHGVSEGPVGYVQGGLMNPAGAQLLTTMILAKECGVEVDQETFDRALTFFYRFAGHMAVPYGDHRTEAWLGGNGKNGMLSAALSLLDGKAYQMAAQMLSLDVADSYYLVGQGHGSSFGDQIWRGLGSAHVPQDRQANWRRSLEKLTWYYDLCRFPKGGFGLLNLGSNVQDEEVWGHGLGLVYTVPRKTLRITGAPHTKYSQKVKVPDVPWGRPRDLEFLRTDTCEGFGKEELEPHEIFDKLGSAYHAQNEKTDKALFVKLMRHYSPVTRHMAGLALGKSGATNEILAALQHADPRVRRAGLEAITQYRSWWGGRTAIIFTPTVVSQNFLPSILKILKDKDASLWEIDGALPALGMAELNDVSANLGLIRKYLRHEEWWLREAAWRALEPLAKDGKRIEPLLPELLDGLAKETHLMPRRVFTSLMRNILKDEKMDVGIKQKVAAGMVQAMRDTAIDPDPYMGRLGRNHRYEILRFFLAQAPETAPQVLDDVEQLARLPDQWTRNWGWPVGYFTGDVWGNLGIIKAAEKLGKEKATPILARCKQFVAKLDERKKEQGADVKAIESTRAAIDKAIQECEKRMEGK